MPLLHKALFAIKIGGNPLQQVRPLDEASRNGVPLAFMHHDGDVAQGPSALRLFLAILPKKDTRIAQVLVALFDAAPQLFRLHAREMVNKRPPDRAYLTGCVDEFVRHAGQGPVAGEKPGSEIPLR